MKDLLPVISGKVGKRCQLEGNLSDGIFAIGQAVGLIEEIKPVGKIVEEIIAEAASVMNHLITI